MTTNPKQTSPLAPSMWRRIFCSLFLIAALLAAVGAIGSSRAGGTSRRGETTAQRVDTLHQKIASWVMQHTANGQQAEFFVVLADQADLSGAASLSTKAEKGRYVYQMLLSKSQTTQAPILQWLNESNIKYQSFYIINAILVKGNRQLAEALAAFPEVASIEGNPVIHNDLPQPGPVEESPSRPAAIEPGITYTHAPQVWALGYTGQNIVIASADTGVRWTHNALKPHYRGWDGVNANHNYNWHDSIHNSSGNPCGNDSPFPCDDFFHGSHTTGTAIGDDGAGNQIGMAPGAKWIGCRNMDVGNGTPARYIECMQFFLAPYPINCTPADGDPTKAPDVTINSWGCPASEGCTVGNELQAAVEAQRTAGIQMVVAAGNSGPNCSTVSDPPSYYDASYTAGALNTGTDTIAGFSSRGPVIRDGSNRIKPDICAPGTGTRSASNAGDASYTTASGTSMATPHIAGAMGLLWCAMPSLRHQINASRTALDNAAFFISSTQCGTAGPPNNVYGWGRVDIANAVGIPSPTPTPSPTPSPTASPPPCGLVTPTPTATATATPTCGGAATWQPGPDQPPARYAFQGALGTDNMLYVAGGQTADATPILYNQVSRYNNTTNTWSNVASLPVALGQGTTGAWNGKIYVAGGFIGGTSVTNALRIYDIASNTWTSGANMPTSPGVEAAAGAVVNGKFYVMGGDDFNNFLNTNFIYDIATNTWTTGATLPDMRTNTYGTAASNGLIYVYGGVLAPFTAVDTLLRYDPVANSWTSLGSAGTGGRGNYGGISPFGTGQLLITDGADSMGNSTTATHIFTISSGTFSAGPAMIGNRAGQAQGTLPDGRVLVADGFNTASTTVSTVELLTAPPCPSVTPTATATATATAIATATRTPTATPTATAILTPTATATATRTPTATPTGTPVATATATPTCQPGGTPGPWSTAVPGPSARYRAGGTTDGTYSYVYGGQTSTGGFLNDLWRWNPATQTWTQLANMPTAKGNIQGTYWNGKIYVPGGFAAGVHITENAIYDIATNTWSTGAPLPAAQTGTNVAFNNKVYNFGGNPGPQSTVTIYDIASNTWSTGAAMPVAITYGRATAAGGFGYYAGGIAGVTVNTLYRYSFAGNTWTTMAPLQTARTSCELMTSPDNSKLFAVMGGDSTFFTGVPLPVSVEIYDIAANTWTYGNPVVVKAAAPSGGLAQSKLMVQGGVDTTVYLDTVQVSVLQACPSATPTATATATATAAATATRTPTPTPTTTTSPTATPTGTPSITPRPAPTPRPRPTTPPPRP